MEQIRLSYAYLLEMHIQYCIRYKKFRRRITEEELKRNFLLIDRFFFDESGKINWETIRRLMPPGIEEKIKKEYNILNENEIRLCCMILFNVQSNVIADLLPYTQTSIHSITYRIKQKTGMKNIMESLKYCCCVVPHTEQDNEAPILEE